MRSLAYATGVALVTCGLACQPTDAVAGDDHNASKVESQSSESPAELSDEETAAARSDELGADRDVVRDAYPWLESMGSLDVIPLESSFDTPNGYERVDLPGGSFGSFLRGLPTYRDKTEVLAYDGRTIRAPSAGVVALDVGDRNLQQCADTAIRLHAEFLWSTGDKSNIAYHFTSGDRSAWSDWAAGERFNVSGSSVERVRTGKPSTSRSTFRDYLDHVFMYAGTRSLRFDSEPAASLEPGAFFVAPGSPGHAVIILDVAENDEGERIALLGQGFMPAQELHILTARDGRTVDEVWWKLPDEGGELDTPSWQPFSREDARVFKTRS
jgi:hypothetical protein